MFLFLSAVSMADFEKVSAILQHDGHVDFNSIRKLSNAIQRCTHAQNVLYPLETVRELIRYFIDVVPREVWTDERCHEEGLRKEPREAK